MNIFLSKLFWHNRNNVWVTGFIRIGSKYLRDVELLDYFSRIDTITKFKQSLYVANGQFSVVIRTSDEIWAATDRLRNYPIFYSVFNDQYILSDDCYKLVEMQQGKRFNKEAFDSFLLSGYVMNNLTLIDNIFQIEAGEYIVFGNSLSRSFYHDISNMIVTEIDFMTAVNDLHRILYDLFKNHFLALSDKFIAIALSGGFDSRLVAAMCSKFHPGNVIFYTYGIENNIEVPAAKEVAKRLGIRWINIIYDSELIEGFLDDKVFMEYFPYASNLSSMFFLQEYFAVKFLKDNRIVPDNCVFMQGSSGDMLAGAHLTPAMKFKVDENHMTRLIFKEFFRLIKPDSQKESNIRKMIRDKVPDGKTEAWKGFENWDQKERQAKFIINSARVFSYFGFNYVLPLWDNLLMDFFSTIPFKYKLDKKLYDYVLTEYIFKDSDLNFSDELNPLPLQKSFQRIKEKIKPFIPAKIRNLFIEHQNANFYDEITNYMVKELDVNQIIRPYQLNYFNSYIVQWYLNKTRLTLDIKD